MATNPNASGFRQTTGDATGKQTALLLPDDYRVLHIAEASDAETDWNVAAPTHPTLYVHSSTTPATDYMSFSHDGTAGTITVAGGTLAFNGVTSLGLQVGGTEEVTLSATSLSPTTNDGSALGTTALGWADLHLATGGVINFANGEVTLTEATNSLSIGGGDVLVADGFGVVIGHTAQIAAGAVTSELQMHGTAPADSTALLSAWSADAVPPRLYFAKSRSATVGTFSIITTGDNLGEILAFGDDGVDFNSNANASAAIIFDSTGTIAADRIAGRIVLQTATDAQPSVLTTSLAVEANGEVVINRGDLTLGSPGVKTGDLRFVGTTSGTVTVTTADAAGTWTMQLPAAAGGAGQQLTDAGGDGITSWAAASLGEWKNDLGILDPEEALQAIVRAPTHIFTYNADVLPSGQSDGNGNQFTGIFAEEAPWAMYGERDGYRSGIAFSAVNAFGYTRAAIEALAAKVARLEAAQVGG